MTENNKPIEAMSGPELVALFNKHSDKKVKRFATRDAGLKRVKALNLASSSPASPDAGPLKSFGAREGTNLEKLINKFLHNVNTPITVTVLMQSVYGKATKDYKGKLMMVMNGVKAAIKKNRLPYEVVKTRVDKENHFALCTKKE